MRARGDCIQCPVQKLGKTYDLDVRLNELKDCTGTVAQIKGRRVPGGKQIILQLARRPEHQRSVV